MGDVFPALTGEALSGKAIALPYTNGHKATIVVFSFSKTGGDDARLWNERLSREVDTTGGRVVLVLGLQAVPRLIRGVMVIGIKRGVPPNVRDRMLVVYHDQDVWKRRLAVTEMERSYVILVDANGRVGWKSAGPYGEHSFLELRSKLR